MHVKRCSNRLVASMMTNNPSASGVTVASSYRCNVLTYRWGEREKLPVAQTQRTSVSQTAKSVRVRASTWLYALNSLTCEWHWKNSRGLSNSRGLWVPSPEPVTKYERRSKTRLSFPKRITTAMTSNICTSSKREWVFSAANTRYNNNKSIVWLFTLHKRLRQSVARRRTPCSHSSELVASA